MSCSKNGACPSEIKPSADIAELVDNLQKVMDRALVLPSGLTTSLQEFHDHTILRNALAVAYQKVADTDGAWSKAFEASMKDDEFRKAAQAAAE